MFLSESEVKSAQINHRLRAKTALNKYVGEFWCERQQEIDLFTGITLILVKNILMMDLFLTNAQLLASQD